MTAAVGAAPLGSSDVMGSLSELVTGVVTSGSGPALLTGSNDAAATIALYPVADPTGYGLVSREAGPSAAGAAPAASGGAASCGFSAAVFSG